MKDSKLLQLLAALDRAERRELRKFLRSPFFNLRADVADLFDCLSDRLDRTPESLEKTAVFEAVFPGRAFDDLLLRHTMSMLLQQVKHFLAYRRWAADPEHVQLDLCEALQEKELAEALEAELLRARAALDASTERDADFFLKKYRLEQTDWNLSHRRQRLESGEKLRQMDEAFSAFVTVNSLRHRSASLAQNQLAGAGKRETGPAPELHFLDAAKSAVESGQFGQTPAALLYYHSCQTLENADSDEPFRRLAEGLENHWQVFKQQEIKDLYTHAINFCIRRINAGRREFVREAFQLYRSGLERRVLLENGFLSKYTYNNVLLTALALQEWDWALAFLEKYKSLLPPRDRENSGRFNLAVYWFRRPDYDRVLEILQHVEFRDVLYNLESRRMLLRIFFEREEWFAVETGLESFKQYLRRHRNIGYHRELNLNFLKIMQKLLRLRDADAAPRKKLRVEIETMVALAEKNWLLEMVAGGPGGAGHL